MDKIRLHSFPLYPEKLLSSIDLQVMEPCEFGMYCRILFASYIQEKNCYIKNDDRLLAKIAGTSLDEWLNSKEIILREFNDENGYLYNETLLEIYKIELRKQKKVNKKHVTELTGLFNYTWEQFWHDYDKKVGDQSRLIPKWIKLSDKEREMIKLYIPKYKLAQPDKMFRKNPETFLNQRGWTHEIIKKAVVINKGDTSNYHEQQ